MKKVIIMIIDSEGTDDEDGEYLMDVVSMDAMEVLDYSVKTLDDCEDVRDPIAADWRRVS